MSKTAETFDVVVVGSGATGGWAAKKLTEAGLRVALVEAGRKLDPAVDFKNESTMIHDSALRGQRLPRKMTEEQPVQSTDAVCNEFTSHLFVKDTEHPYTTPPDRPFLWIRSRHVGGKTISWGRTCFRLSSYDLNPATRDGYGVDWPLTYEELAPYYDEVETFIGVSGMAEGLPQLPDGKFLPPMEMTCGELWLRKIFKERFGRTVTIARSATLTRDWMGRPKCHHCGPCSLGCVTGSYFSTPVSTLPAAVKTGRLVLMTDSIVSHVTVNDAGLAKGVWCVDRITRAQREIRGRVIVLCASALESTRVLLNSKSSMYPAGLGNTSGVLGRYFMIHPVAHVATGFLPSLSRKSDRDEYRSWRPVGIYVPRWQNLEEKNPKYIRGYQLVGASHTVGWGHAYAINGFGPEFKRRVREESKPCFVSISGFAECLPRYENHVRLDDKVVDAWGIPALHIDMSFADNEQAILDDMGDATMEMLEAAGVTEIQRKPKIKPTPGRAIHEAGLARMGDDPKTSFVNRWCQSHAVKNLFLLDGASWPSLPCQNITLTLMALAARGADYIAAELRRGNL